MHPSLRQVGLAALVAMAVAPAVAVAGQADQPSPSALNAREFKRYWTLESEADDAEVRFLGPDTVELVAPRGLTLWRNERLAGRNVTVEFDACLVVDDDNKPATGEGPGTHRDRPSDLNCFWMATDPAHPDDIMARRRWRGGVFTRCYSLRLYYMGFGGNGNTTTRFRRYDGDERGVTDAAWRPKILTEYTDPAHLNRPNQWRHIKVSSAADGHVEYWIDGERLVDFRDPEPLTSGWFGIRTTWSRLRVTGFRSGVSEGSPVSAGGLSVAWVERPKSGAAFPVPVTFGVPFDRGEVRPTDRFLLSGKAVDFRVLASWPDGSVKWGGFAGAVPVDSSYTLCKVSAKARQAIPDGVALRQSGGQYVIDNGVMQLYLPQRPDRHFVDSVRMGEETVVRGASLVATLQGTDPATAPAVSIDSIRPLRVGGQQVVMRAWGHLDGAVAPSFVVNLYVTAGTPDVKLVHTFIYNIGSRESAPFGTAGSDPMLTSLGLRFGVPLRDAHYNRHVAFGLGDEVWHEPVQPLHGRRTLSGDISLYASQYAGEPLPSADTFGPTDRDLISHWAKWDGYRLSQLSDEGFTLRKRAKATTPWIGTLSGRHADGTACVADSRGGLAVALHDFWQSFPSTLLVEGAASDEARLTVYLWSPEAEPMDMRHYDTEPHDLNAAYEDVQEGMSSPFGVGRTSVLTLRPVAGAASAMAQLPSLSAGEAQLACSPAYLHDRRAFGVWSLPDRSTPDRAAVEDELSAWADFYVGEQQRRHWYGYWNYGDVMHAYDRVRQEWMYDVGGFAWDNTELASNMMLWYGFLRTGRADLWRMAVAMSRHTGEVDVYHDGPWAGLGSRHNVTHWGCGAKESRISQAAWNRFYYYLSGGDDRTGDLMSDVKDADTLLYHLDPMRLAQPRELYPCTAPARLRIGPDWLGYVANWMTEWERTGSAHYRDKILAGMTSIVRLPNGIFSGPKALGYDPATGVITLEGDTTLQNTNHLLPIMGGFELMGELLPTLGGEAAPFAETWLQMCRDYRQKADSISHNGFLIPRLHAYAAWHDHDAAQARAAWRELWRGRQTPLRFSTNGVATWTLDAIYMLEVCPPQSDGREGRR